MTPLLAQVQAALEAAADDPAIAFAALALRRLPASSAGLAEAALRQRLEAR